MSDLPLLFDACVPRPEVLSDELPDAIFAARLNDVVQGRAHPFYQDPVEFFAQTYATDRMKSLARQVSERLRGSGGASAYYRLDTPFGGGKTHTLVALWHLVTSGRTLPDSALGRLGLTRTDLPAEAIKLASAVGLDLDPSNGVDKDDGVRVYHLWGELAYQLGGADGYALVQESDRTGLAPSADFLDRIVGDAPVLILIDELANYLRRMPDRAKSQLPAFFQNLTEWASASGTRRALVVTFAEDAFQQEAREIQESLAAVFREVRNLSGRYETVITPAERQDYAHILRQRLFERVDNAVGDTVARAYADLYRSAHRDDFYLPESSQRADYLTVLRDHYPFHPAFIDVLDGKLATIPGFQRTRGALRLVARVIQRLWQTRPSDAYCIQPHHLDLGFDKLRDELTGRLDRPRYQEVASTDVYRDDGQAHAQLIDRRLFGGELPYAERIATVIFLHSLPEPPARGVYAADIRLAVLTPDSNPGYINKALQELNAFTDTACWHLDSRGDGEGANYFFGLEPNLNRMIIEEMQRVQLWEVRQEVERRVKNLWKHTVGFDVDYFPGDSSAIRDEAKAKLAFMHWDTTTFDGKALPDKVREFWEWGPGGGYRRFRNGLTFLVAASDRRDNMLSHARRYLAIDRISRQPVDQLRLSPEKLKELRGLHTAQESATGGAIARAYNALFYPSEAADPAFKPFAVLPLSVEDQGRSAPNMLEVVVDALHGADKLKRNDDAPLGAAFVIQNAFNKDEGAVTTAELSRRFFERARLPIFLTDVYLRRVILTGVKNGQWLLYDPARGGAHGPATITEPAIAFNQSLELMLPAEATRRNLKVLTTELPPEQRCPRCGRPLAECTCDKRPPTTIEVQGEPGKAFGDLEAQAKDAAWPAASRLQVAWDGQDAEVMDRLIALRFVLGQASPLVATATVAVGLDDCRTADGAAFSAQFKGSDAFYQQRAAAGLESVARHFDTGHVGIVLDLVFARGLAIGDADWGELRLAFQQAGLGAGRWTLHRQTEEPALSIAKGANP